MRSSEKCNNSHAPNTGFSNILLSIKLNIPEGPEYEKYQLYLDAQVKGLQYPVLIK